MEQPRLRPVPSRPPGPVDPDAAREHVALELPGLAPGPVAALALVDVAGETRAAAAEAAGLTPAELAAALAQARTALRRALHPLPGSGWCGRAERLLSDRRDSELDDRGTRVLDGHLANCPRCVEHDRRLSQARDGLVDRFVAEHIVDEPALPSPEPANAPVIAPAPPELHVVEAASEPVAAAPEPVAAPKARVLSSVADAGGHAWVSAAGLAVALTILSVLIVILGALGASITF